MMTTAAQRVDLFTAVHKGLRTAMFEAVAAVGRADFGCADGARNAAGVVRHLLGLTHEHGEHEDRVILAELDRVAPVLSSEMRGAHVRLDGAAADIERCLTRLDGAGEPERIGLGRRLHDRLGLFVADHLVHMAREEAEVTRALWAHFTDAQLVEMRVRIVVPMPRERYAEWLALMLPAMSPPERATMLAGMRAALPAEQFEALLAPARSALGESLWARTLRGAA